jgi:hypothetical protein
MSYGLTSERVGERANPSLSERGLALRFDRDPPPEEGAARGAYSPSRAASVNGPVAVIQIDWTSDVQWQKRVEPSKHSNLCGEDR